MKKREKEDEEIEGYLIGANKLVETRIAMKRERGAWHQERDGSPDSMCRLSAGEERKAPRSK